MNVDLIGAMKRDAEETENCLLKAAEDRKILLRALYALRRENALAGRWESNEMRPLVDAALAQAERVSL